MTMRTYRYFVCPQGHEGEEKTSESDHPHSEHWESVSVKGMKAVGEDVQEYAIYTCSSCGETMSIRNN
jgi:hypothetical protein